MNIQEFQDKLKEIQTLAMKNGKQVQAELVEQFFGEEGMDQEKLKKGLRLSGNPGDYGAWLQKEEWRLFKRVSEPGRYRASGRKCSRFH